jgi:hypothetical protein
MRYREASYYQIITRFLAHLQIPIPDYERQ